MVQSEQIPIVSVRNVTVRFGGIVALDGVSFDMDAGRIVGLIGPNGAGKTTLFNCLSGLYRPTAGDVRVQGRSLLAMPPPTPSRSWGSAGPSRISPFSRP